MSKGLRGRRLIKTLVLAIIGVAVVTIFITVSTDIETLYEVVSLVNPIWYSIAFISVTIGVAFYTLSWLVILNSMGEVLGFRDALRFVWVSIFFNLLIPTGSVSGEAVRTYLTFKRSKTDMALILASIMSHRVMTLIPFIVGSSIGLIHLTYEYQLSGSILDALILVVSVFNLTLVLTLYLMVKPEKTMALAGLTVKLGKLIARRRFKNGSFENRVYEWFRSFQNALRLINSKPTALAASTAAAFLFWISDVMVAFLTFKALGASISLSVVITVYTIGILMQMIPIGIPGMVGPVEVTMITLYSSAGVDAAMSTAATLLIRAVMMWYMLTVGGLMTYGSKTFREEVQKALVAQ